MANKSMNKEIVVLPSWYPNKLDQFGGDFIQRHVKAISLFRTQYIIYVVKDEQAKITTSIYTEVTEGDNYTEKIIYYHIKKTGIKLIDKLFSQIKSNRIYHNELKEYVKLKGCPGLIHVHVVYKAGLAALWANNKWSIPFIITEHWTIFLKEANYKIEQLPVIHQIAIRKILKNACAVTVVSDWLGKAMQNSFPTLNYRVIPNVVDHAIFFSENITESNILHFIHPSSMNYQKNTESILHAFCILKKNKYDFVLNLLGPAPGNLINLVNELNLNDKIFFKGEVSQILLAKEIQQSDALILYSRFETFGCVLIEAHAVGIPVIVSDIPVFHELVSENENGFFVKGNDPKALATKLEEFILNKKIFDKNKIINSSQKYSYTTVGKQFVSLYDQIQNSTTCR